MWGLEIYPMMFQMLTEIRLIADASLSDVDLKFLHISLFNGANHITLFMLRRSLLWLASRPISTMASQTPLEDVMRSKVYHIEIDDIGAILTNPSRLRKL